jgi:hypothetical protein
MRPLILTPSEVELSPELIEKRYYDTVKVRLTLWLTEEAPEPIVPVTGNI